MNKKFDQILDKYGHSKPIVFYRNWERKRNKQNKWRDKINEEIETKIMKEELNES